jgi:anaerobic ribonucleoside-triphosphate reductase activating protein
MLKLNIANIINCTEVEGPGKRFAIWLQGCLKRCKGCCNPEMLDLKSNQIIGIKNVIKEIQKAIINYKIEGITFIGGEPFLQAKGLSEIANYCRENNLSVMIFSGYTLQEIQNSKLEGAKELLNYCDILVDGEFEINNLDNERNWIGSKNQDIHLLSNFYSKGIEYSKEFKKGLEFRIMKNNIQFNGDPINCEL